MKQSSKWLRAFNVFLSSILALLGYTSCGESSVEYGTPYAKYEIKGKVTDKENKNAVSGARVIVKAESGFTTSILLFYGHGLHGQRRELYLSERRCNE